MTDELEATIDNTPVLPSVIPFEPLSDIDIPAPLKRFTAVIAPKLLVNTIFALLFK